MTYPTLDLEKELWTNGYMNVVGLDEVGRGPLAGPVVAGAVLIHREDQVIPEVRDSKKMTEKAREVAFQKIMDISSGFGIGIIDVEEIDRVNIRNAVKMAMELAIRNLIKDFNITPDYLIADGGISLLDDYKMKSINKGDLNHYSISAASVIAKVTRDRLMKDYAIKYPEYGFESHVGYGTKKHIEAIYKYGVTPIHRKSFAPISNMVL